MAERIKASYTYKMKFRFLLKSLAIFFLLTFSLYLSPSSAKAEDEFSVDANVTYQVQESGKSVVTHEIYLENNFSTLYATTYTLSLENIDAGSVTARDDNGKALVVETKKEGDKVNIKINFNDAVVGRGAKRHFFVVYENGNFAVRTGEIWEVSIPRLADENSFRNYSVTLDVPSNFGLEAYVSPKADSQSENGGHKIYSFKKSQILETGITAGFGAFQVFSFNLSYHLENPLSRDAQTQVALPPDTAFQKVYIQSIEPKPMKIDIDSDGNWLATYKLKPRQRVDVTAMGAVQIFASFRPFPAPTEETLASNLKESEFWQVNDAQIKTLAAELKTPRAIYDYVSKNLKYDFARVQPNVQRMGAYNALKSPTQAICMEFTDLFIAIARAAGIPAREVNGYAYTENPALQPLSLVADVLHAWPEYYDRDLKAWVPIDPTWGSTTGGQDFFSKLDLRHFAFVMHGVDSNKPYAPGSYKLGPNPQKDVFVSFGKLPEIRTSIPVLSIAGRKQIPFFESTYNIKIENPGPVALYSLSPIVHFDKSVRSKDFIEVMPPYSSTNLEIKIPFSLLGKNTPDVVKVTALGSQIEIPTNKTQIVINSLLMLCALFLVIILGVLIRLKKINLGWFNVKIQVLKQKLYARFGPKPNKDKDNA